MAESKSIQDGIENKEYDASTVVLVHLVCKA